jgi:hypothetical protein
MLSKSVFSFAKFTLRGLVSGLFALYLGQSHAMNFEWTGRYEIFEEHDSENSGAALHARFSGKIMPGDYKKFLNFIRQSPKDTWWGLEKIDLDSTGGDVQEAMLLAKALADLYPTTIVRKDAICASACVLLWLSGSSRIVEPLSNARIGIHRPVYSTDGYYKGLSLKDAQQQYAKATDSFNEFVLKQGLPESLIEKLMATSSNEIYWLSPAELSLIGSSPPFFAEKFSATCPKLNKNDFSQTMDERRACERKLIRNDKAIGLNQLIQGVNDTWWELLKTREAVEKDNWVLVTASEDNKIFINTKTIRKVGNNIWYWQETKFPTTQLYKNIAFDSIKSMVIENCHDQTLAVAMTIAHTNAGAEAYITPPKDDLKYYQVGTNPTLLAKQKFACNRTRS